MKSLFPFDFGGGGHWFRVFNVSNAMSVSQLTILFGTMTGNAEDLATQIQERADAAGVSTTLKDLAKYPAEALKQEQEVAIVISTWGEGDPPDEAEEFCFAVFDGKVKDLASLRYSIVALGDSSYDDFCGCGRKLDEALRKQGATRVMDRVELDIDFEDGFASWLDQYEAYLKS
jgi:sulfite reductase (NADPH) flavoprotein alpha-component